MADTLRTRLIKRIAELEEDLLYCNATADLAIKHRDIAECDMADLLTVARRLLPYTDRLICFASTIKEYPLNGIVKNFTDEVAKYDDDNK